MEGEKNDTCSVKLSIKESQFSGDLTRDGSGWKGRLGGPNGMYVDLEKGVVEKGKLKNGVVKVFDRSNNFLTTYDGEWENGLASGYGKFANANGSTEEGMFSEGRGVKIFSKEKKGVIVYYREKDLVLELAEEPPRDKDGKIKMDPAKLKPIRQGAPNPGHPELGSDLKYYSWGKDGNLEKRVRINFGRINELLSGGTATDLQGLLNQGAIVVEKVLSPNFNSTEEFQKAADSSTEEFQKAADSSEEGFQKVTDSGEARKILKAMIGESIKIQTAKGVAEFGGINIFDTQTLILSETEDEDLKNVRFHPEGISRDSITSFLESIKMDKKNLFGTKEKYIVLQTERSAKNHGVCFIVDLEKIRKIVKQSGNWKSLNEHKHAADPFILCYDSSRASNGHKLIDASKNLFLIGDFGSITENIRAVNWNLQEGGTCGLHSAAATLAALKNHDMMERLLAGTIPTYRLNEHKVPVPGDVPNEFMLKQLLEFHGLADTLGFSDKFPVEDAVIEPFTKKMSELAGNEALLGELEKRIRKTFELFEEQIEQQRNGTSIGREAAGEYRTHQATVIKEYRDKLSKAIESISREDNEVTVDKTTESHLEGVVTPPAGDIGIIGNDGEDVGKDVGGEKLKEKTKQTSKFSGDLKKINMIHEQICDLRLRLWLGGNEVVKKTKGTKFSAANVLKNILNKPQPPTASPPSTPLAAPGSVETKPPTASLPPEAPAAPGSVEIPPPDATASPPSTPPAAPGSVETKPPTASPPQNLAVFKGLKTSSESSVLPPSSQPNLPGGGNILEKETSESMIRH